MFMAAANLPRNAGAGVLGRDVCEEAKWHPSAGATEFFGIVETDSDSWNPGITAGSDRRHVPPQKRRLRRSGRQAEDKA